MPKTAEETLRSLQKKLPLSHELEKSIRHQLQHTLKELTHKPTEENLSHSLTTLKRDFEKILPYGTKIKKAIRFLATNATPEEINMLKDEIKKTITQIDAAFSASATRVDPQVFLDTLENSLTFTSHKAPSSDSTPIQQIEEHISNYLELLWLLNNIINEIHQLRLIIQDPTILAKAQNQISKFSDKLLPSYKGWLRLFEQTCSNSEETLNHVVQSFSEYDLLDIKNLRHKRPEYLSSRIDGMRKKIAHQMLVLENLENAIEKIDDSKIRKHLLEENDLLSHPYVKQSLNEAKTPDEKAMIILTLQGISGETLLLGETLLNKNKQLLKKTLAAQERLKRADDVATNIMLDIADTETPQNVILPHHFFSHQYTTHRFALETFCKQHHTPLEKTIRDYINDRQTDDSVLDAMLVAIGRIAQADPTCSLRLPSSSAITKTVNQWLEELEAHWQKTLVCNNVITQTIDYFLANPDLVSKTMLEKLAEQREFIVNTNNFLEPPLINKINPTQLQQALLSLNSFELQDLSSFETSKISSLQMHIENHVTLLTAGLNIATELQQLKLTAPYLDNIDIQKQIQHTWKKVFPYYSQWVEGDYESKIRKNLHLSSRLTPEAQAVTILFIELLIKGADKNNFLGLEALGNLFEKELILDAPTRMSLSR